MDPNIKSEQVYELNEGTAEGQEETYILVLCFYIFVFERVFFISGVLLLQSEEHGGEEDCEEGVPQYGELREQDRFLPNANVARIMEKAIPAQVSRTTITSSTFTQKIRVETPTRVFCRFSKSQEQ